MFTNNSLTIPEGTSNNNLCVQLTAGQGKPAMYEDDIIVSLSVTLNGKTGINIHYDASCKVI